MTKPIVVVGSVNLDLVCNGKRIPAPGETLTGEKFQTFFGGKGANQAVATGRLGYPVSMIAKVGDDAFGSQLRRGLRAANVNVRQVGTAKDTASGVALISVDAKGQNSIMVIPGANGKLLPHDIEQALPALRAAGMILTQLEIPMETVVMLGVFMSLDFFLFYVFWEVMLVPMYFLIGVWGGPRKLYAAIKFFLYTLVGSVLMLLGILALYFHHHTRDRAVYTFDIPTLLALQLRSIDVQRCSTGCSWHSLSASPSRSRCSRSTPGCRTRTSKRPRPARSSWPAFC